MTSMFLLWYMSFDTIGEVSIEISSKISLKRLYFSNRSIYV
nr:MAG TPA: hypothetical protein [Caudoviricetes sp.]